MDRSEIEQSFSGLCLKYIFLILIIDKKYVDYIKMRGQQEF